MADSFIKILDLALETVIFEKFKDLLTITSQDTDMAFMPKEVAFRYISEKRGKVEMEFMNLWRSNMGFDWSRNRSALAIRNIEPPATAVAGSIGSFRTVPVKMQYDFWLWSKDKDVLNACAERYMFWQFRNPNIDLSLNNEVPLGFDLHFGDVTDESTERMMFEHGTYYVYRFPIQLDGWIFELSTTKIIETIYIKGYDDTIDAAGKLLWSTTITSLDEGDDVWGS